MPMARTATHRVVTRWHVVLLCLLLAATAAVRFHALGQRSLWSDEYLSLECSAGWGRSDLRLAGTHAAAPDLLGLVAPRPWTTIWPTVARDENHPPLFFLLLRAWRDVFGDAPAALRSLSAVASVVAVGLTVAAGVEAFGPAAGLWAGLVMAVASPQVHEAQDARAYMPLAAVGAWALLTLVRMGRRGPSWPRAVSLFVALLAMPLMHYMALASVGAVAIYAAAGLRGSARRATLGATAAALVAYAACWGPHLFGQHQTMLAATEWLGDPAAGHRWRTLGNLTAAPIRLVIDSENGGTIGPAAAAGGLIALVAPPLVLWARGRSRAAPAPIGPAGSVAHSPPAHADPMLLMWVWLVTPIAVAFAIDLSTGRHSLEIAKYTLVGAPGLYLLLAAVAGTGRRLAWVPAAAVAAACLICLPGVYRPAYEPDWRLLARSVLDRTGPADPVVLIRGRAEDQVVGMRVVGLLYWLSGSNHRDLYVLDGPPTGEALSALRRARRACVVGSAVDDSTDRLLPGLTVHAAEMFVGLAIIATADRDPAAATSQATVAQAPTPDVRRPTAPVAGPASTRPPAVAGR